MSAGLRRDDLIFLVKASSREHDLNAEGLGCISNNHEESSNLATDTPQYLYPFSTNSTWLTYRTIEAHRGSAEQLVPQDVYKVLTLNFSSAWFFRIFLSRKRKVMTQRQAIIIRTCSASVMPFTPWLTHLESFLCSGNENSPSALHHAGHKTAFRIILKLCGRGVSVTGAEASQLICWNCEWCGLGLWLTTLTVSCIQLYRWRGILHNMRMLMISVGAEIGSPGTGNGWSRHHQSHKEPCRVHFNLLNDEEPYIYIYIMNHKERI